MNDTEVRLTPLHRSNRDFLEYTRIGLVAAHDDSRGSSARREHVQRPRLYNLKCSLDGESSGQQANTSMPFTSRTVSFQYKPHLVSKRVGELIRVIVPGNRYP